MKYFLFLLVVAQQVAAQPILVKSEGCDRIILTKTLLGEARGEGREGMIAVAAVIKQRMINRKMTLREVCLQPKQFSCWNSDDPNLKKLNELLETEQGQQAWIIANEFDTICPSIVSKANHYMTVDLWKMNTVKWAEGKSPVKRIGNHVFFKL